MSSYQFVNPYNFIPLQGKRAKTPQKPEGGDTYTGVIHYSVLTKTPLFIPNTSNQDAFCIGVEDHKSYDFFSYTDLSNRKGSIKGEYYMPVIPGSEMRGMLRSNFEILTNSCMSAIDDDVALSKRTNETFEPGLLRKNENGTYDLYAAEDCLVRTKGKNSLEDDWTPDNEHYTRQCYIQDDILEGTKVHVEAERRGKCKTLAYNMSTKERAVHNDEGYVIKGEVGPEMPAWNKKQQKHCCHVFIIPYEDNIVQRNVPLDTLDLVLAEYKKNGKHPYTEYAKQYENFKKLAPGTGEEYFPVYYSDATNKFLMLSPACITREIYQTKLKTMIGSHAPCKDKKICAPHALCLASLGKQLTVKCLPKPRAFAYLICVANRSQRKSVTRNL